MSTFTTIKTSIRDAEGMYRVLKSIPDAKIDRDVIIPTKQGGLGRVAFRVGLGDSPVTIWGAFAAALKGNLPDIRIFFVDRAEDGTFVITINQDLKTHEQIQRDVQRVIDQAQSNKSTAPALPLNPSPLQSRRIQEPTSITGRQEQARREAANILARLDSGASKDPRQNAGSTPGRGAAPGTPDRGPQAEEALQQVIAQQYSKEMVLGQLGELERDFGVSLGGIETLKDGTIEITLRG